MQRNMRRVTMESS